MLSQLRLQHRIAHTGYHQIVFAELGAVLDDDIVERPVDTRVRSVNPKLIFQFLPPRQHRVTHSHHILCHVPRGDTSSIPAEPVESQVPCVVALSHLFPVFSLVPSEFALDGGQSAQCRVFGELPLEISVAQHVHLLRPEIVGLHLEKRLADALAVPGIVLFVVILPCLVEVRVPVLFPIVEHLLNLRGARCPDPVGFLVVVTLPRIHQSSGLDRFGHRVYVCILIQPRPRIQIKFWLLLFFLSLCHGRQCNTLSWISVSTNCFFSNQRQLPRSSIMAAQESANAMDLDHPPPPEEQGHESMETDSIQQGLPPRIDDSPTDTHNAVPVPQSLAPDNNESEPMDTGDVESVQIDSVDTENQDYSPTLSASVSLDDDVQRQATALADEDEEVPAEFDPRNIGGGAVSEALRINEEDPDGQLPGKLILVLQATIGDGKGKYEWKDMSPSFGGPSTMLAERDEIVPGQAMGMFEIEDEFYLHVCVSPSVLKEE